MRRLEVVCVDIAGEVARDVEFTLDECAVDDEFRLLIGDLARAPSFDLLAERIEVPLDAIYTDRQRIDD